MEEVVIAKFNSLLKNLELVNSNVDLELLTLKSYLEKYGIYIREHGFFNLLKGKSLFIKFVVFAKHLGMQQAVQRLANTCFS